MALADNLTAEKNNLIALLESEYTEQNLRDSLLERLYYVRFLLGELGSGGEVAASAAHVKHVESQLTAPSTSTNSRNMDGFNRAFITATVANINTNVVLRIEGSNDNSNWVNLNASDADTTITANGTYGFQYVGCPQHIRTTFVSESGGTSATVNVITRLSA